MTNEDEIVGEYAKKCNPAQPFFNRREAYVLSAFIAILAFILEYHVLFSELSGGSSGKLLVAIPAVALILISSILTNSK